MNIAEFHPQIVHFVVALLIVGVVLRLISLTPWLRFSGPAAASMLLAGAIAGALAVKSGDDAHGPVERIPGVRALVIEHEELGEQARNIFLAVATIELIALGLAAGAKTTRFARFARAGSALVGLYGLTVLYHAAEHGGELVYSYAGGPGLRTGEPKDVERLLIAGLYNQSQADRRAGRREDAARLVDELARRMPTDTTVRFLRVESLLADRKDPAAARAALDEIAIPTADARLRGRHAGLLADIHLANGRADSARAVLTAFLAEFPANTRLKAKLDSIPTP